LLGLPFLEPAIEHGDGVVPEPAQQPPQPAGEHRVVLVVRDHLNAAGDAETAEGLRQRPSVRHRMTAVRPVLGPREIPGEIRVHRARNVRRGVFARAPLEIVELRAAVDDGKRRIVLV